MWPLNGFLGVQIFFVISGFVIPYSLYKSGYKVTDSGRFLLKRLIRLHPPLLGSIAFSLALIVAADRLIRGANYWPGYGAIIGSVTLLASWLHTKWVNPVYWTLVVEFQWYLLVAFGFYYIGPKAGSRSVWLVCLAACLVGLLWPEGRWEYLPRHLTLFVTGVAVFRYKAKLDSFATASGLLGVAFLCGAWRLGPFEAVTGLATGLAIVFLQIRLPVLHNVGAFSYSLYLFHTPILVQFLFTLRLSFLEPVVGHDAVKLFRMFLGIMAAVAVSWAAYKIVEVPSQRLANRIRMRPPGPGA